MFTVEYWGTLIIGHLWLAFENYWLAGLWFCFAAILFFADRASR